jgi:hypothetical protein
MTASGWKGRGHTRLNERAVPKILVLLIAAGAVFTAVGAATGLQVVITSPPSDQWTAASSVNLAGTVTGLGASVRALDSDSDFGAGTSANVSISGGAVRHTAPANESYRYFQDFTGLTGASRIDEHWLWHMSAMSWSVSASAAASASPPSLYHTGSTTEKTYWSTFLPGALRSGSISLKYWCDTNGILGVYVSPDGRQAAEQTVIAVTGPRTQATATFALTPTFSGSKNFFVRVIAGGSSAAANACSVDDFEFNVTYAPEGAMSRVAFMDDFSQGERTPWDWSDTWWGLSSGTDYRGSDFPPSALHGGKAQTSAYANWATVTPIQTAVVTFTYKGESNARIMAYLSKDGISETNILSSVYGPSHTTFSYNASTILSGGTAAYLRFYADATQDLNSLSGFDNFNLTIYTTGAQDTSAARGTYSTPVEDFSVPVNVTAITWVSTVPPGNLFEIALRASTDGSAFTPWMAVATSGTSPMAAGYRYFQVRANFTSAGGSAGVVLDRLSFTYRGIAALEWTTDGANWTSTAVDSVWTTSVPLAIGTNSITVRATDTTGAISTASVNVLRDGFPPEAPGVPVGPAVTRLPSATWAWSVATDTGLGVTGYLVDAGTTPNGTELANGVAVPGTNFTLGSLPNLASVYVRVRAEDGAGLRSAYSPLSQPTLVDRTPPGTGVFQAPGDFSGASSLDFAWTEPIDLGSWIDHYLVRIGSGPGAGDVASATVTLPHYTLAATVSGARYYASVTAVDAAGNTGSEFISNGTLVDRDVPSIPGPINGPAVWTNATILSWSWGAALDPGSGVSSYSVRIGSTQGASDVASVLADALSFDYADGLDGHTYFFSVAARDRIGNEGPRRDASVVRVDRQGPGAPLLTPAPAFVAGAAFNTTWIAPADLPLGASAGVDHYVVIIQGVGSGQVLVVTGTGTSVPLLDGVRYTVTVAGIDGAGNWGDSATANFTADNTGPSAPPNLLAPPPAAGTLLVNASWSASADSGSGVREYRVSLGTTPGGSEIFADAPASNTSVQWIGVPGKTYYVTVWAVDNAGNVGPKTTSGPVAVTVAATPITESSSGPLLILVLLAAIAAVAVALLVWRSRKKPHA